MTTEAAWFYLHGFGSSNASAKARAFVQWGTERGVDVRALDLRVPSLEHLRLSAIIATVREAIDELGERGRCVLIGSSLGGLTACLVAEAEPRVSALFLLAPALKLAERWRARIGEDAYERWAALDQLAIKDYLTGQPTHVDFGFILEAAQLDVGFPDVRVPTCIVHGTKDEIVDVELSREWQKNKRHIRLVEVDDGHELVASTPKILAEADRFFQPFIG